MSQLTKNMLPLVTVCLMRILTKQTTVEVTIKMSVSSGDFYSKGGGI